MCPPSCMWNYILKSIVLILLAAGPTGTIVGTVFDNDGAVVPNAKVEVRSQETDAVRSVETNGTGDYDVPLLPPGLYTVSISAPGFTTAVQKDVIVAVAQTI